MTYEKSCGALVIHFDNNNIPYVLMIKHVSGGHRSFPKGHVEEGETEHMTAEREVMEETSVSIKITEKFRQPVYYRPRPGAKKEVVYFVATTEQTSVKPRAGEVAWVEWVPVDKAITLLAHANDKKVLSSAMEYMDNAKVH